MATNPAQPSSLIAGLFERGVAAAELRIPGNAALIYPSEAAHCARFAPRRIAEFAGGRLCARLALAQLGIENVPIAANPDRSPSWPLAVTGSITHTHGFCAAAVAQTASVRSLGIDAEMVGRVTPELRRLLFTSAESGLLEKQSAAARARSETVIFSAKEAFYKCQYPLTHAWRDFDDVALDLRWLDAQHGTFVIRPSDSTKVTEWGLTLPVVGHFRIAGELVVTGLAIANE